MAEDVAQPIIPNTTPVSVFDGYEEIIVAVAVFPDGRRMVTGSKDNALRLWDLKNGVVLKKMKGHSEWVRAVAVTGDGQLIASGDISGALIAWDGDTGESLTEPHSNHDDVIFSLDFSPDGTVLATGSWDCTTKLWNTETWQLQENPIYCRDDVFCVRYSPSGEHLAIATKCNIQIWNPSRGEHIKTLEVHARFSPASNFSLAWMPDGKRLLSGSWKDPKIRVWDSSTWKQAGTWKGRHADGASAIVVDSTGTLVACASHNHVNLMEFSNRRTIATFKHSHWVNCLTFSTDCKGVLSGGSDKRISKWAVPEEALPNILPIKTRAPDAALLNAQKVIDRNPSSYRGYQLKHAALHDAQRYDEAITAFESMLSRLETTGSIQTRRLRQHYLSPSEAEAVIRTSIHAQLDNAPLRLIDTTTGLLCDREARIYVFKTTTEYKEILSFAMKHPYFRMQSIQKVVEMFFRCVMLSHRWGEKEPLLHDIRDKVVYKLKADGGIAKLQSFCKIARDLGYRWAWSDTSCINKNDYLELQLSLNSMFVWYRHSSLTIVYLADVPPSSKPGTLAKSEWNRRGWTVGEFLAPKVVLFYQKDWTPYLDDHSPNHKESIAIIQEMRGATGIDKQALVAFCPGMTRAREKLQWASTRVTTLQEDIAYSLFGIFGIHLPVIYGEQKHNALGRLLQEILAQSGDVNILDWVGKSSEFNSCLPADITSYKAPPYPPPSLSENEMQASASLLREVGSGEFASSLYQRLYDLSAPRFAHRRLHLHCIAFPVTDIRRRHNQDEETYFTYNVKTDGLHNLRITTGDKLIQFSGAKRTRRTFMLVRPWNRSLLELPGSPDDTQVQSVANWSVAGSSLPDFPGSRLGQQPRRSFFVRRNLGVQEPVHSESASERALRLLVRLGRPFSAFLLEQQPGGEYKRVASDRNIIAQVKDVASVRSMMDVRTLEIL